MAACGLNFADLLMQDGRYQEHPALPYTPGMEFAGLGRGHRPRHPGPLPRQRGLRPLPGRAVWPSLPWLPADRLVAMPDSMSFAEAAGFQIAYGTSHLALDHKARLQPGETLLVLGAAGGVGLTAVEIGKRMGARVIACARGPEKRAVALAAGADAFIDSDTPDLKAAFKAHWRRRCGL